MTDELWKAAQATATTVGKDIDAGRESGGFIAPIMREPLEVASGIVTDRLPEHAIDAEEAALMSSCGLPSAPAQIAIWNLVRLGCLDFMSAAAGTQSISSVKIPTLGLALHKACSRPAG